MMNLPGDDECEDGPLLGSARNGPIEPKAPQWMERGGDEASTPATKPPQRVPT